MDVFLQILLYLAIFVAKMVEVSLATLRTVLNSRGEKVKGALIGFFEVMIWLVCVSVVLTNIEQDLIKALVYCLAFSAGNYIGVTLEAKLAIGTASIMAMVGGEKREELTTLLREAGYGVTVMEGHGMQQTVDVIMIYLKRKAVPQAIKLIHSTCPDAVLTVNDVRQVHRAFIKK